MSQVDAENTPANLRKDFEVSALVNTENFRSSDFDPVIRSVLSGLSESVHQTLAPNTGVWRIAIRLTDVTPPNAPSD